MKHIDIIQLSISLAADATDKDEAYLRNIIGRSYYGVYHHAVAVLEHKLNWSASPNKYGVHEKVISRLDGHPSNLTEDQVKFIESLKQDLINLKKKRVKADYRLLTQVSKAEALFVNKLAVRLVENLEKLPGF